MMEYLDGTEYVIDTVSRDGVHRVCAIWKYDKRSVNGANFVYFGMELRSAADKVGLQYSLMQQCGLQHGLYYGPQCGICFGVYCGLHVKVWSTTYCSVA